MSENNQNKPECNTEECDTQAKIVDWVSDTQQNLCTWLEVSGFLDEVCTLFNPTLNHYNISRSFNGREMDYFGYLAHSMTQWKEEQIFNRPLEMRAPSVVLFTAFIAWGKPLSIFKPIY